MKKLTTILILLTLTLLIIGCSTTVEEPVNEETTEEKTSQKTQDTTVDDSATDSNNVKEFDMIAKQFSFEPSTITVNKGDKVKINVRSTDVEHGISIPEFGVNKKLPSGEERTIEFTADQEGEFSFICSVYCGSGHGNMKGTLIVE